MATSSWKDARRSEERFLGNGGSFPRETLDLLLSLEASEVEEDARDRRLRLTSLLFLAGNTLRGGRGSRAEAGFAAPPSRSREGDLLEADFEMAASLILLGDQLRFLGAELSLGAGDEGLDPAQDFRASVRIVPVTDRLRLRLCSPLTGSLSVFRPPRVSSSSCSWSDEKEKMPLVIRFFAFLEARRKRILFVEWEESFILVFTSGGSERTLSEKVLLIVVTAGSFSRAERYV